MKQKSIFTGLLLIISITFLSGCITNTNVLFESNIEGASIFIDGQPKGEVPVKVKMSNAIWKTPDIRLEKKGYKTAYSDVERTIQPINLITGIFLGVPLLWSFGPESYQYIEMFPES